MTSCASSRPRSSEFGWATLALLRTGLSASRMLPDALRTRSNSLARDPRSCSRGCDASSFLSSATMVSFAVVQDPRLVAEVPQMAVERRVDAVDGACGAAGLQQRLN